MERIKTKFIRWLGEFCRRKLLAMYEQNKKKSWCYEFMNYIHDFIFTLEAK